MNNQVKESNQPSKKLKYYKYMFIAALIAVLSWLLTIIYVSGWVEINEDLYAKTFMAWRSKGGDAALFTGRYKGYSDKDLPSKPEIKKFLEIAQTDEALLLAGNYPLHAPREPENLWSLADDSVYDFWRIECEIKAKLNKTKSDDLKNNAKTSFEDKKYEDKFKPKWFTEDKSITSDDIKECFGVAKYIEAKDAAKVFVSIIEKLCNEEPDYGFVNGKVTDNFFEDINILCKHAKYNDVSKERVNKFFYNMAVVRASVFDTFIYSRLFNMWVFLTINHEYKYTAKKITDAKKDLDDLQKELGNITDGKSIEWKAAKNKVGRKQAEIQEAESKEKANIFAQIFAKVYSKPYDYELKEESIKDFYVRIFGTTQDVSKIENQDIEIQSAIGTAITNVYSF